MSKLFLGMIFTAFIIVLGIGCSTNANPVENLCDTNPAVENSDGNHTVTGVYNASFDPDTMEFTVTPVRNASLTHFDFTQYLDMCPNGCLRFLVMDVREDGWLDIGVLVENPTSITVYDARLIFANPYNKKIADIDGYTVLWPSIGIYSKPFLAFAKESFQRAVEGYTGVLDFFSMRFVPGCTIDTLFITECSFGENIQEPYEIVSHGLIEGYMTPQGGTATMGCDVLDWQRDVEWVKADLSLFTHDVVEMVFSDLTNLWECEISNPLSLPIGEYNIPIEAYSPNVWDVNAYGWVTVEVMQEPGARKFVYSKSDDMGVFEVYSMFTNASLDTQLTFYSANTQANGVTADFSKIIYDSDNVMPGYAKGYRMNIDGSDDICLFKPSAVSANSDGSIVLLYDAMGMSIWIYNEITSDLYQLPQENVFECVMAADNPLIAYTATPAIGTEIFTCDFMGMNDRQMTNDGDLVMAKIGLSISDNGMKLAYSGIDADAVENDMEIYVLDLNVPDSQINITANTDIDDTSPQFDGMSIQLVFVSIDHGASNIMIWNEMDGVTPITEDSVSMEMVYTNPDISPDGLLVVFETVLDLMNAHDIVVYNMASPDPEPVQITSDGFNYKPLVSAN
jgi:hypothetical protein